jgi:hypothetical protein
MLFEASRSALCGDRFLRGIDILLEFSQRLVTTNRLQFDDFRTGLSSKPQASLPQPVHGASRWQSSLVAPFAEVTAERLARTLFAVLGVQERLMVGRWHRLDRRRHTSRSSSVSRITGMAFGKSVVNLSVRILLLRPATCLRDLR